MNNTISLKWNKFIPEEPTPKQIAFLSLPHLEVLFGGSAGSGKSSALLASALQYCDVPGYSAILFRKTITDHKLPDSILSRAKKWLEPFLASKEVKWVSNENTFHFASGATLTFGYLDSEMHKYRYQSARFHFVGMDECTQIAEDDYLYLFSRIRKSKQESAIPLRFRSATNPGGKSHQFIKDRFQIRRNPVTGKFHGHRKNKPFIPASLLDNPYLGAEYAETLDELGTIERDRLKFGDWDSQESAIFDRDWFNNRYTIKNGEILVLHEPDSVRTFILKDLLRFCCVDSASSERTGIEGKSFRTNTGPSYSVCGTFAVLDKPPFDLVWLHNFRSQCKIPILQDRVKRIYRKWKPSFIRIQDTTADRGVGQNLDADGLPMKFIPSPTTDKVVGSIDAQIRAERGRIWLPKHTSWLSDLENELFAWTGHPKEVNDQIDVLSSGASEAASRGLGEQIDETLQTPQTNTAPMSTGGMGGTSRIYH